MAHPDPTRRALLAAAPLTLAPGALAARGRTSARRAPAPPPPLPPEIVNALGSLANPNLALARAHGAVFNGLDIDARAIADAHASGVTAVNVTLGYVAGSEDPFGQSVAEIAAWDSFLRQRRGDFLKVDRAADILQARNEKKIGVIYGFQNSVQVADGPGRVETFAGLGVRVMQLTYNPANVLGDGSMAPKNRGLTPLGRQVIERMNAARVMTDLSHSGETTCLEAIAASNRPVSINHTGCRALADLPRNKTDAELRGVADKGGFIGIYFMPFLAIGGHPAAAEVVAHIDYAVNLCGEDHVGIGTDGTITPIDDLSAYKVRLAQEVADRASAGVAAKGERADTYPFVLDLRGAQQFHRLAALLKARGYSDARVEKILGRNFVACAAEVWGA